MKIRKMTSAQIEVLNELLAEHGDTLTAFYDEGILYGWMKGVIVGVLGGSIITFGAGVICAFSGIKTLKKEKENGKES